MADKSPSEVERRGVRARLTARGVSLAALLLVLGVLVLKIGGIDGLGDNVGATTLALIGIAIVLAFIALSPESAVEILGRITSLKIGSIEIALEAAERVESQMRDANIGDDVGATTHRPRAGTPADELAEVRIKLEQRLELIRREVLELDPTFTSAQTLAEITGLHLLDLDEERLALDILTGTDSGIAKLDAEVRLRYLESSWRFASRFATLVFERQVRRQLARAGWLILDFEQARSHRQDFLAFRGEQWLALATRLVPEQTPRKRFRLLNQAYPFGARKVIVYPDAHSYEGSAEEDLRDGRDFLVLPLSRVVRL